MAAKKPQVDLEAKIRELEKKVSLLFKFLKEQHDIRQVGGDVFGNYPQE